MALCKECGAQVPDSTKFCIACGKPMVMQAGFSQAPQSAPQPVQQQYAPQPAQQQSSRTAAPPPQMAAPPSYYGEAVPPRGSRYAVMSVGSYVGHSLLFSLPVVGWLICLIMAFAASNQNKKNYARAMLVFFLIGLILAAILYFVCLWISEALIQYFGAASSSVMGGMSGVAGGAELKELGGIAGLMEILKDVGGAIGK